MAVKNPAALLERLCDLDESDWLEFKVNNFHPDEIGTAISALANSAMLQDRDKAYIVFGVEDKTRKRIGTDKRISSLKVGNEDFINWISHILEPRLMIDYLDFEINGIDFSVIVIEPTYDRPVKFKGCEYLRIGANVKKLAEYPNHERSLWQATNRRKFEQSIALSNQSETRIFDLLRVDTYFKLLKIPRPTQSNEILRKLCKDGILEEDMEGGFHIANLGAILLAADISEFPTVKGKSVRVIGYKGTDKREAKFEQEGTKGYAVGFSDMMRFIMQHIPTEEKYLDGVRSVFPLFPEIALREVIANALIHQDFTVSGSGPVIEIYADRVEVTNPGNSLIEPDRMKDERRSRNEKLATALRNLGICEERGGGLDKALLAIEENHLPALDLNSSQQSMRVVIFGPKSFSEMSKADKHRACFYHCVLQWIKQDYMSNMSLRERFSLKQEDYQSVSAVITECVRLKRIAPAEENQGRKTARYVPYWAA